MAPDLQSPPKIEFNYQPVQTRLFRSVKRGGGTYIQLVAPMVLEIGGIRSGKTVGKLKFGIEEYCLRYGHCDILFLRRKFGELESGLIQDFKTIYKDFLDKGLCKYNEAKHIATFSNGSRAVFGGCQNNKDRDIEQYLGSAYSFILMDECGQFSPDAWEQLSARNIVNIGCQEDEFGNLPIPSMAGCTNPIGPFWEFYGTVFAKHCTLGAAGIGKGEPFIKEEGIRRSKDGQWWVETSPGEFRNVYNPNNYAVNHSTMLDNHEYLKRNPNAIERLRMLPLAKQKKFLYGLLDRVEGQYFECFSNDEDVIDLREDPMSILWQPWQPVWGGQDWGMGHWNACYLFTKALVRHSVGEDYRLKTVCFAEVAPSTTGHTSEEMVDMISAKAYYPRLPEDHPNYLQVSGKRCDVKTIYFSHEKFNRVMEKNSPADLYSIALKAKGLPRVTRGTMDRIGSASFVYNCFKKRELVILKTCPGIIQAIPQLQRDPDNLDDVLKSNSMADDRYDAFRLGVFGGLNAKSAPDSVKDEARTKGMDPFAKHFYNLKQKQNRSREGTPWVPDNFPSWWDKE